MSFDVKIKVIDVGDSPFNVYLGAGVTPPIESLYMYPRYDHNAQFLPFLLVGQLWPRGTGRQPAIS